MHVDSLQLFIKNTTVVTSRTQHPSRHVRGPLLSPLSLFTQVTLSRRRIYSNIARGHLLVIDFLLFSETRRRDSAKVSSLPELPAFYLTYIGTNRITTFSFQVLSEMTANITVSWDMVLCTLLDRYQGCRETHCHRLDSRSPRQQVTAGTALPMRGSRLSQAVTASTGRQKERRTSI
jgi:hypothetical protein